MPCQSGNVLVLMGNSWRRRVAFASHPENSLVSDLYRLIYVSRAVGGSDADAIALSAILHAADKNNRKHGLTGLLLAHDGAFCQVLEGPPDAIHGLMAILEIDRRHDDIRVLCDMPVKARFFADWTMARIVMSPILTRVLGDRPIRSFECETALAFLRTAADDMRMRG